MSKNQEEEFEPIRQGKGRREGDCGEVCSAHSGTVIGIRGLYALLIIQISLIGCQMLFQIPAIRIDILTEVKGLTARIVDLEKKDIEFKSQVDDLRGRVINIEKVGSK